MMPLARFCTHQLLSAFIIARWTDQSSGYELKMQDWNHLSRVIDIAIPTPCMCCRSQLKSNDLYQALDSCQGPDASPNIWLMCARSDASVDYKRFVMARV